MCHNPLDQGVVQALAMLCARASAVLSALAVNLGLFAHPREGPALPALAAGALTASAKKVADATADDLLLDRVVLVTSLEHDPMSRQKVLEQDRQRGAADSEMGQFKDVFARILPSTNH